MNVDLDEDLVRADAEQRERTGGGEHSATVGAFSSRVALALSRETEAGRATLRCREIVSAWRDEAAGWAGSTGGPSRRVRTWAGAGAPANA